MIAVVVLTTGGLLFPSATCAFDERQRVTGRKHTWQNFGDKAFLIAAVHDEAISGLKAVQIKPPGPLIPHIPAPARQALRKPHQACARSRGRAAS